ncbi:MAG: hypothetical protein RMI91_06985 [Gemmatales bacterium]|nr:hypothetical protein [Gemmatales bacterium]
MLHEVGEPQINNDNSSDGKVNFVSNTLTITGRLGQYTQAVIDLVFDVNNTGGTTEFWFEFVIGNHTSRPWEWMQVQLGFLTGQDFVRADPDSGLDFDFPHRDVAGWPKDAYQKFVKYREPENQDHPDYTQVVEGDVTIYENMIEWNGRGVHQLQHNASGAFFFNVDIPDYDATMVPPQAMTATGYTFTIRFWIQTM